MWTRAKRARPARWTLRRSASRIFLREGVLSNRVIHPEKEAAGDFYLRDSGIDLGRFAAAVLALGVIGWLVEAMITAIVVQFIYRVRRELICMGRRLGG